MSIDSLIHGFYHGATRNVSHGNLRHEGDTLYSYAEPIAQIVRGKGVVIVSTERFSNTTSKHQSLAARYSPWSVIYCPCRPGKDYIESWLERNKKCPEKATVAGTKQAQVIACAIDAHWALTSKGSQARHKSKYASLYAQCEKLVEAGTAAAVERERKKFKKRQEELVRTLPDLITDWRAGKCVQMPRNADILLRLDAKKEKIETSWGVSVPVSAARPVWETVQAARRESRILDMGGVPVGSFHLDKVYADGSIKAGCHTIKYEELRMMAETLGFAVH